MGEGKRDISWEKGAGSWRSGRVAKPPGKRSILMGGQAKSKYMETTEPNVQPIWLQESEGVLQVKLNMLQYDTATGKHGAQCKVRRKASVF
jgi:hypothetical protein